MKPIAQSLNIGNYQLNGPDNFVLAENNLGTIIGNALPFLFSLAGIGLLLMIISSGFTLVMSAGDPKKAAAAKTTLTNAVIGFVLIFAAFWITQALGVIFGWQNSITAIFGQ